MTAVAEQTSHRMGEGAEEVILRARNVRREFRMGDSVIPVLKSVDLTIRHGEFIAIEGRSGSGKSTLLHILGALDAVDGGILEFEGSDYTRRMPKPPEGILAWFAGRRMKLLILFALFGTSMTMLSLLRGRLSHPTAGDWVEFIIYVMSAFIADSLLAAYVLTRFLGNLGTMRQERPSAQLRNKAFGFVFQFYHLLPELNVLENTLLGPMIEHSWLAFRSNRRQLRQRATDVLTQLGMDHRLKHRPNQLSGGERQRVAIARALMNKPRVLFADEPTGNLDAETGRQIMAVLEQLHQQHNQTIIMVTHDRSLARKADRTLILKDGHLEKPPET
jgi:ABC-type lipoprotein export system ATPase subunit